VYGHSRPDRETVRRHHLAMLVKGLFPTPRAALATSKAMSNALVGEVIDRLSQSLDDLRTSESSPIPSFHYGKVWDEHASVCDCLCEFVDQWGETMLGHIWNKVVKHAALAEQ
jgi:hypothetical protein